MKLSFLKLGEDRQRVDLVRAVRNGVAQRRKVPERCVMDRATRGKVCAGEKGAVVVVVVVVAVAVPAVAAVTAVNGQLESQGEIVAKWETEIKLPLLSQQIGNQLTRIKQLMQRHLAPRKVCVYIVLLSDTVITEIQNISHYNYCLS